MQTSLSSTLLPGTQSYRTFLGLAEALFEKNPYQMVSGHRRKMAAELAELPTVSCIVRELTDDEAVIIMVDSNLQREQVLPSEKAFAYKMKLDAMKRQGQRTDLTSPPLVEKLSGKAALSTAQIGKAAGESHEQVRRFVRLTNLIPELLDMVDSSVLKEKDKLQMALHPAVELSYLTEDEQRALLETMTIDVHPLTRPGHQNARFFRERQTERRCNPLHHAGGKAQPGRSIQNAQRPHQQVFLAGDARAED